MNKEVHDLLYSLPPGTESYAHDLTELETGDIPPDRIVKLKKLMRGQDEVVALTAARILCGWGDEDGFEHLRQYVCDHPVSQVNLAPHRLRGYDDTYKQILDALVDYFVRGSDAGAGDIARKKIFEPIQKIISLSGQMQFGIEYFFWLLSKKGFTEYVPALKEHLVEILKNEEFHHWKVSDCVNLLKDFDLPFVERVLQERGKTLADYPATE